MNPQNNPVEPNEDNKPSAPIPVMDIQPPAPRTVQPGTDIHINSEDGTMSQPEEARQTAQSIPVNITPNENMTVESVQDAPESSQQISDASSLNSEQAEQIENQQPQENPMAINQAPKPKSKTPTIIIIIAIFVVIGLISAAIVLFLNKEKNTEKAPTQTNQTTTQPSGATQQDVDNTVSEVDKQIQSTNDQTDIPSAESVNDASLGL